MRHCDATILSALKVILCRTIDLLGACRPSLRLDPEDQDLVRLWVVQEFPFVEGTNMFEYSARVSSHASVSYTHLTLPTKRIV